MSLKNRELNFLAPSLLHLASFLTDSSHLFRVGTPGLVRWLSCENQVVKLPGEKDNI